jgi:hypothetical protein
MSDIAQQRTAVESAFLDHFDAAWPGGIPVPSAETRLALRLQGFSPREAVGLCDVVNRVTDAIPASAGGGWRITCADVFRVLDALCEVTVATLDEHGPIRLPGGVTVDEAMKTMGRMIADQATEGRGHG